MKKYVLPIAAAAVLALVPLTAKAEQDSNGKFYIGLDGGLVIPGNTSVNLTGTTAGSGHFSYKDGYQIGGFLGYHFNDLFSAEGQLAYDRSNFDKLSGTLTGGAIIGTGNINVNGNISAFTGFLNGIISPFHNGFVPYAGGGVGFADARSKISSISFNGVTSAVNSSENQTDFAADGLVGFDIPVGQSLSVGARYQYLWVNSAQTTTSNGITEKDGNFNASIITARLSGKF